MMLLLDFAVVHLNRSGGKKPTATTSVTILTESNLSVNNNNKKELDQNQESSPLLR